MPILDVPGVYINEVTSPGVIAGIGTSTAAFIGPALNGPINVPTRISSFDDFLATFGLPQPDGSNNPYMVVPRPFYMAFGVRGFYDNGGTQAYVIRVGTAAAAAWDIKNANSEAAFRVAASQAGAAGNGITVATQLASATGASGAALANPSSKAGTVPGLTVTVAAGDSANFRVGDIVTREAAPEPPASRATITKIDTTTDTLTLSAAIPSLATGDTLRIASILPTQTTFRLASPAGIFPGTVADLKGMDDTKAAISEPVLVLSVDGAGFVTLASAPARTKTDSMSTAAGFTTPTLVSREFRLIVNVPGKAAQQFDNLSMSPQHPNYVFFAVSSPDFSIVAPAVPPVAPVPQNLIPAVASVPEAVTGSDDNPGAVGLNEYQHALDALKNIQDVNIVTIPDAASNPSAVAIQTALVNHCQATTDRFAVVDSQLGAPLSGAGSVAAQVGTIPSQKGYAALYYPWLTIKDPTASGATLRTMLVPPSGAIAGVYARTDNERGVHKAPANTDVRGVLGLEKVLSDAQQGPLNLLGIDVLRIFPGTSQVTVWGARTVDMAETDWMYVNVRRLMIYIEQSIKEGLRWAVFEPNGLPLWQRVKRTLNEFLTRVWQSGALFGATADKAFYVRVDEGNNPPALRAKGELHIEIGVAPVRPAEFIVVTIGLWDGGAQISET
jgi:phage tail sheath protein FI